jgi:hypothetical protein
MIYSHTRAKVLDSVPCQVSWLGSDNKPIVVNNVTATLFRYVGLVKTTISGPVAMGATDQAHRYITKFVVPADASGQTLFVEFTAEVVADGSTIYGEMTLSIDPPVSVSTTPNNIITVV